ncbi:MAG: PfkB family carbohydrate kinase [Spirosomataceae bacterium]
MTTTEISSIFDKISGLRIGVIGDFAIDFYYDVEKNTDEFSIETLKEVHWGSRARTSLGGAGNVVQNLAALGVGQIAVFGCIGPDLFGREMVYLLQQLEANCTYLQTVPTGWETNTYTKPLCQQVEDNRLDFGGKNKLSPPFFEQLLADLDQALPLLNVLIINQQFSNPLLNTHRLKQLNEVIRQHPHCLYVADMRAVGQYTQGVTLKVNTSELSAMLGIALLDASDEKACIEHGKRLSLRLQEPLLITRGEQGILYLDANSIHSVPAIPLDEPIDTVGAGDTVVASFAAARGTGATLPQALQLANLAAAVTVKKLNQTGTATLQEILELC